MIPGGSFPGSEFEAIELPSDGRKTGPAVPEGNNFLDRMQLARILEKPPFEEIESERRAPYARAEGAFYRKESFFRFLPEFLLGAVQGPMHPGL